MLKYHTKKQEKIELIKENLKALSKTQETDREFRLSAYSERLVGLNLREINLQAIDSIKKNVEKIHYHQRLNRRKIKHSAIQQSGITEDDNFTFCRVAQDNQLIMMWRPVNEHAAQKLKNKHGLLYKGKGMNTKGKSSKFGPIAGDIPYVAALSKLADPNPDKERQSEIKKYQSKNDKALESSQKEHSLFLATHSAADATTKDSIERMNERLLLTTEKKETSKGKTIFYVYKKGEHPSDPMNILWDQKNTSPLFIIEGEKAGQYCLYENESKDFSREINLDDRYAIEPVKIMCYTQFKLDEERISEEVYGITADYDELVTAARKIYPFHNNDTIRTNFTQILYNKIYECYDSNQPVNPIEIISDLIVEYEEKIQRDHLYIREQDNMGSVNDWQMDLKSYLKHQTNSSTNHGAEVNNPFPEELLDENYAVHLPDGTMTILHNEKEICDFINKKRQEGFPLDVNPAWGWSIDEKSRNLIIPDEKHRINWRKIRENISYQCIEIQNLESIEDYLSKDFLISLNIADNEKNKEKLTEYWESLQKSEDTIFPNLELLNKDVRIEENVQAYFIRKLTELKLKRAIYASDLDIMNTNIQLQRYRLHPDIVYSDYINCSFDIMTEENFLEEKNKTKNKYFLCIDKKEHTFKIMYITNTSQILEIPISSIRKIEELLNKLDKYIPPENLSDEDLVEIKKEIMSYHRNTEYCKYSYFEDRSQSQFTESISISVKKKETERRNEKIEKIEKELKEKEKFHFINFRTFSCFNLYMSSLRSEDNIENKEQKNDRKMRY